MSATFQPIRFDLFGEPPVEADIQAAKDSLTNLIKSRHEHAVRRTYLWFAFVLLAAGSAGVYWQTWWAAFVVAAVLLSPTSLFFPPGDVEERQLAELQPVGIEHLDDVIAACELDPRVDIYRQKVAQQPRDLVLAEAWAFRRWKYSGYQDSCSWATVRSTGPIEAEDLSANRKPALQWVGPTDGESV
jgi:hypothetical protein